jgi:hypothetical protein
MLPKLRRSNGYYHSAEEDSDEEICLCQNPSSSTPKRERNGKEYNEWRGNVCKQVDPFQRNTEHGPQQTERFVEAIAEEIARNHSYHNSWRYSLGSAHSLN